MKSGYDQFFKNARKTNIKTHPQKSKETSHPKINPNFTTSSKVNSKEFKNEKDIVNQLRKNLSVKKTKKVQSVPWKLITISFAGVLFGITGFLNLDKIEKYLHRIEISILGHAIAEEPKATQADKKATPAKENDKEAAEQNQNQMAPAVKKDFSQDEINHFSKLNERKKELDAREEELLKMEAELQNQKAELEEKIKNLEQTRKNISQVLEDRVQKDDKKVDTLVEFYSNMKPQQAAKIFETLDEDLAVEILGRMKKKNAAEILNLLKPEKAQVFSEKYAGYKSN
jgi:flagellar motility protein MotE (MotC chaperone)